MIKSIYAKSRNLEVSDCATRMGMAYEQSGITTDLTLASLFNELNTMNQKLADLIRQNQILSQLEQKDELRDEAYRALYFLIMGYLYNPNSGMKAAAQSLAALIDRDGLALLKYNYAIESAAINALLIDLDKGEYADAIATLPGCSSLIEALRAAQLEFNTVRVAYESEISQSREELSATDLKKEVLTFINKKLIRYLNGMLVADEETLGALCGTLAEITQKNNQTVKMRLSETTD